MYTPANWSGCSAAYRCAIPVTRWNASCRPWNSTSSSGSIGKSSSWIRALGFAATARTHASSERSPKSRRSVIARLMSASDWPAGGSGVPLAAAEGDAVVAGERAGAGVGTLDPQPRSATTRSDARTTSRIGAILRPDRGFAHV